MIPPINPKIFHIIHLEWAEKSNLRWAFTLSNAGSRYFEDRNDLSKLADLDWVTIKSKYWKDSKENKQAEFLVENCFPWQLVEKIGVKSQSAYVQVINAIQSQQHKPVVQIQTDWYY